MTLTLTSLTRIVMNDWRTYMIDVRVSWIQQMTLLHNATQQTVIRWLKPRLGGILVITVLYLNSSSKMCYRTSQFHINMMKMWGFMSRNIKISGEVFSSCNSSNSSVWHVRIIYGTFGKENGLLYVSNVAEVLGEPCSQTRFLMSL